MIPIPFRGAGLALVTVTVMVVVLLNRLVVGSFDVTASPISGIGFLLGGLILAGVGWYLNVILPRRNRQLLAAASGPTTLGTGPSPAQLMAAEHGSASNHHHLLFIPVQFWSVIEIAFGIWILVTFR